MKTSWKNIAAASVICVIFGVVAYRFYYDWNTISSLEWWRHPGLLAIHFGLLCACFALWTIGWRILVQAIGQRWNLRVAAFTWLTGAFYLYLNGALHSAFTLGLMSESGDLYSMTIGIGAWLGTIMLFNVWVLIWPNQKKVLGMVEASADEIAKAKNIALLASRSNTLMSFPLIMSMVGAHHGMFM